MSSSYSPVQPREPFHTLPYMVKGKLSIEQLRQIFRTLTVQLYNTKTTLTELERDVFPLFDEDVRFEDPWQYCRGMKWNKIEWRGAHCILYFSFDLWQLGVDLNEQGTGGRCFVDGVMQLSQLQFYTYPLRTQLVYDFYFYGDGNSLKIKRLEEMWSFADFFANAPIIGPIYNFNRLLLGVFWTFVFYIGAKLVLATPWNKIK